MLVTRVDARTHVLVTLRSDQLSAHPGELSFPGGRVEPGDASIAQCALRETEEETGIRGDDVQLWGHVEEYTTFRSERLSVFAGAIEAGRIPDPTPVNEEVHRVLLLPLESLRLARSVVRPGHDHAVEDLRRRRVHACDVESYYGLEFGGRLIHYWPLLDGHVLWGITGDLVAGTLRRAYGWVPPEAPTRVATHEDVRPRPR